MNAAPNSLAVKPLEAIEEHPTGGYSIRNIAALDGLRALAVIAAMLFHANVLRGGFLGVDLFFVLSGYLITTLLLKEGISTGRIRLGVFWRRRVRRLAPALLAVLAVTVAWIYLWAPPSAALTTSKQTVWSLAYANNWFALFADVGYWGVDVVRTPLNHLWSLAIEEQFYLAWPLLVMVLVRVRQARRVIAITALCAAILSGLLQVLLAGGLGTERAYLGTDTRAIALFLGCFLAAMTYRGLARTGDNPPVGESSASPFFANAGRERAFHRWILPSAILWLGLSWIWADLSDINLYRGWLVSCSVAAMIVVGAIVINSHKWLTFVLSARPLVWIGKRSYSLYLWHWPIWIMLSEDNLGVTGLGLWWPRVALTVLASMISYKWIEQPIRTSKLAGLKLAGLTAAPAIAMAALILRAPPALPVTMDSNPVAIIGNGGQGSLKVLLAGDSWARNMGFGLSLADVEHRHSYINLGAGACGVSPGQNAECANVRDRWAAAVATHQPDVALLMTGTWDQDSGAVVDGQRIAPCDTRFAEFYGPELDKSIKVLAGDGHTRVFVVGVRDNVNGDRARSECINQALAEAAERNSVRFLDLNGLLCPEHRCALDYQGEPVYDETKHLAPAGQRWAGGWILATVQNEVVPGPGPRTREKEVGPCTEPSPDAPELRVKSYRSHPDAQYPESGGELKDGERGQAAIDDPAWQGWQSSADITLDLGTTRSVCAVTSSWLQVLGASVYPPPELVVYVSNDPAATGTMLGSAGAPQIGANDQISTVRVAGKEPLTGRYVTLHADRSTGWSFIDEIAVHGAPE